MGLDARQAPQAGGGDGGVDHRADHAAALVDHEDELPALQPLLLVGVEPRLLQGELAALHVVMAQVAAHGLAQRELAGGAARQQLVACPPAAEGAFVALGKALHDFRHHLLDKFARQQQHFRVHQVLGVQHRLQQRRVGAYVFEHFRIGDEIVDLVLLDGVAFEAFDGFAREQAVDGVDPFRRTQRRGAVAAAAFELFAFVAALLASV